VNYKFDSDVDDFIETYEKKVESHILNYLGLLTEFEMTLFLNYREVLIMFHQDKQVVFDKEVPFLSKNANTSIFEKTDLSVEANVLLRNKVKYTEVNNTFYFVVNEDEVPYSTTDEIDDGIIIANCIYNTNIQTYERFKASFIASIAKEIVNAKEALEFTSYSEASDINSNIARTLSYYYYYNKYRTLTIKDLLASRDIKFVLSNEDKQIVKDIILSKD
jgi:hypothetical protein